MRSLKGYMIFDLVVLSLIGCLLEGFITKACGYVFTSTPTLTLSLLIIIIAMARWNFWGILIAPLLALANYIGGKGIGISYLELAYDWKLYVSNLCALIVLIYNVFIFKRYNAKKVFMNVSGVIAIVLPSYLIHGVVQFVVYRLLCSGTLLHSGFEEFVYEFIDSDGLLEVKTVNICNFGENGFVFNIVAFIICIIGIIILRSQGVVCNVKEKLVDDKKNAELNRINTENFAIEEANSDEVSSEK